MAEISFISFSDNSKFFIAAEYKHFIHIYETSSFTCLKTIETIFDSFDDFVIANNGDICIVSAYHVNGVAAYLSTTGKKLWHRKDLKKARRMNFNIDNTKVFISFDDKPMQEIEVETGVTVEKLRGVRRKLLSQYNDLYLLEKMNFEIYTGDDKKIGDIKRESFAALDIIWGENELFITEAGGPVRAISSETLTELWRYKPNNGSHFLDLALNPDYKCLYGIFYNYQEGRTKFLYCFDSATGSVLNRIELKELGREGKFTKNANMFIACSGYIYDLNGERIVRNKSKIKF